MEIELLVVVLTGLEAWAVKVILLLVATESLVVDGPDVVVVEVAAGTED